jgi:hypothetical protein
MLERSQYWKDKLGARISGSPGAGRCCTSGPFAACSVFTLSFTGRRQRAGCASSQKRPPSQPARAPLNQPVKLDVIPGSPIANICGEHWYCLSLAQSVEKFLSRERKLMQVAHGYSQASADVRLLCGQLYRSRFSCQRIRPLRSQEAPSRFESVLVN